MKIVGFVGMPGSGKSAASEMARSMGHEIFIMGDVVRQEAARLDIPPTDENLGMVGSMLRAHEGPNAVAKRTIDLAKRSNRELVVIDGLRSKEEVEFFKANSDLFYLVEIYASLGSRLQRIARRGRFDDLNFEDDSLDHAKSVSLCQDLRRTAEMLERRECRELGWGMCEAFREADLRIDNDGDLEDLKVKIESVLREIGGEPFIR